MKATPKRIMEIIPLNGGRDDALCLCGAYMAILPMRQADSIPALIAWAMDMVEAGESTVGKARNALCAYLGEHAVIR